MVDVYAFIFYLQIRTSGSFSLKDRFSMTSTRKVMAAVLLAPGPVSTHKSVKNLSPAFKVGLSKAKFMVAATQVAAANFGSLLVMDQLSSSSHVFIKKPSFEVREILELKENSDLCTIEEYEQRYEYPLPTTVTMKMRMCLVEQGLLAPGLVVQGSVDKSRLLSEHPNIGAPYSIDG